MSSKQRESTDYIVVHCSATPPSMDIGVKEIRRWHRDQGWLDVGYHFIIRRDGNVEFGRNLNAMGAHVKGHNADSVGLCLIGGVDTSNNPDDNFTQIQRETLLHLLRFLTKLYPEAKVVGHRDLDENKACPSFDVKQFLEEKNNVS